MLHKYYLKTPSQGFCNIIQNIQSTNILLIEIPHKWTELYLYKIEYKSMNLLLTKWAHDILEAQTLKELYQNAHSNFY